MAERPVTRPRQGFQSAIEDLTDGLSSLVRQHFELARTEVRQEVDDLRRQMSVLIVCGLFLALGYILLLAALILGIGVWFSSSGAMALTALILGVLHVGGAALGFYRVQQHLDADDSALSETTDELQKDKQWLKDLRKNSPRALPSDPS